jgi:hypothetical protein
LNPTRHNIDLLVPALTRITGADIQFPWHSIDSETLAYFEALKTEANGETIQSPATFALTLLKAKGGYSPAVGMMHFLNNVFGDLAKSLTTPEKKMACSIVKKILLTFNPTFYHFVGEIATLNNLMATGLYRLKHIEEGLPNGKSIDFYLQERTSDDRILVEVLNIDLDSDRVESDPAAIDKFIAHRAKKKFREKNKNLRDPEEFQLIPVLWGGHADVEVYRQHFKDHRPTPANVIEPLAYLRHSDGHYYFDHQFGRVGNLIRHDNLEGPQPRQALQ